MALELLEGTNGDDFIYVSLLPNYLTTAYEINGLNGNDTIRAGGLDDLIRGGKGEDRIYAGAGDDYVQAGNHDDFVDGGHGDDLISGGAGNDFLKGGKGNDTLLGGGNDDFIYGVKGYNILDGGNGDDWIDTGVHSSEAMGGDGSDTLIANMSKSGRHTLNGGADDDTFVFSSANAKKSAIITVEDFEIGLDSFMVGEISDTDFMASLLSDGGGSIVQAGSDMVLTLSTRDKIIFEGIDEADFVSHYDGFALG
jgi:Ca2+-binding RTX toxin-like protein